MPIGKYNTHDLDEGYYKPDTEKRQQRPEGPLELQGDQSASCRWQAIHCINRQKTCQLFGSK